MSDPNQRTVFIVSDHTGITSEVLGHSLLAQFKDLKYRQVRVPFVNNEEKALAAVDRINNLARSDGGTPIVFGTLADPRLRAILRKSDALYLDVFDRFLGPLEELLGQPPTHRVGSAHSAQDVPSYEARIDSVHFAMHCDDGLGIREYSHAEIVLIGVSRSGKTPTSLYLGLQFGIRAANYPFTEEYLGTGTLPEVLLPFRERLYGLTINPERLHHIRSARKPDSRYADIATCRREVRQAEGLFRSHDIPYINTTAKSVEEIATNIIDTLKLERRLF